MKIKLVCGTPKVFLGGDMASTWAVKLQEHAGAPEVLLKTGKKVIGNTEYAPLAA